jgi:hypothetical protein
MIWPIETITYLVGLIESTNQRSKTSFNCYIIDDLTDWMNWWFDGVISYLLGWIDWNNSLIEWMDEVKVRLTGV